MEGRLQRLVGLSLVIILVTVPGCSPQETKIACENNDLKLSCGNERVLKIHDAVYGRTNTTVCRGQGSETTGDCEATDSFSIVQQSCENKSSCLVPATNSVFGEDPCPNVYKYLEVVYSCVHTCGFNDICDQDTQVCIDGVDGDVTCACAVDNQVIVDGICEEPPSPTCPDDVTHISGIMLTFPASETGDTANSKEGCPKESGNSNSLATRYCGESWEDPVLTQCYDEESLDTQLEELAQTNVTDENVAEVAGMLVLTSSQTEDISPEGLRNVITTLDSVVAVEDPSEEVTDSVVGVANNVMSLDGTMLADTPDVNEVVSLLETQLGMVQQLGQNYTEILSNVGTSALHIERSALTAPVEYNDPFMGAPVSNEENVTTAWSSISLPPSILDIVVTVDPNSSTVPVSFITYLDAGLFQPGAQTEGAPSNVISEYTESQVIAANVDIENLQIKDLPINSSVITRFSKPVSVEEGNSTNTTIEFLCVFWSYSGSDSPARWSQDGCRRLPSDGDEVVCSCEHLTSFTVLIRVSDDHPISERFQLALDIITMIGCVLSIIGLSFCVVAMLLIRSVRKKQQTHLHFNLCLALLGFYLSFLLGVDQFDQSVLCRVMTSLIYFFCLSSVAWMAVEGFYIYMLIWKYKQSSITHLVAVAVLLAWGLPLVGAILVYVLDQSHDYVAEADYCFLHPGPALYYGFLLEVFILFLYNFVIFILVTYRVNSRKIRFSNKKDKRQEMVTRIKSTFLFWVILGMAWLFGFLATFHSPLTLAFQILFCICLSLQGFFMFYMLFVQNPEIKKEIKSATSKYSSSNSSSGGAVDNAYTSRAQSVSHTPKESTVDNATYDMEVNPVGEQIYYDVNG